MAVGSRVKKTKPGVGAGSVKPEAKAAKTKLRRALGLWELVLAGIGIILGAGIYVIIGPAAGMAGNAVWLAFMIAAIVSIFTGLSYAELSSRFPKAGAEYIYTEKAFSRRLAFIVGWLMIFGGVIAASAVAIGFSSYFSAFFHTDIILTSVILIFLLAVLLVYGVKETAWFAIIGTAIEAGGLIIIILISLPYLGTVNYFELPGGISWAGAGLSSVIAAAALIFFAFLGFEDLVSVAEEVKNPVKTMPKAIMLAIAIATVLYILVSVSAVSVLGWEKLSQSPAPLAEVAGSMFGNSSFTILGVIALFATANTVLLVLLGMSRLAYGMADRGILPKIFASVHKTRRTPWAAVLLLSALSMIFVLIGNIKTVASLTNASILIVFVVINLSVIMIRYKERKDSKVAVGKFFTTPVSLGWFPVLPLLGLLSCLFLLANIELYLVLGSIGLAVIGLFVYEVIARRR